IGASVFIVSQLPRGGGAGGRLSDIDVRGALLLAISTVALLLGLTWTSAMYGWMAPSTVGLIGGAIVIGALFILNERRHPQPTIPLQLFRNLPVVQGIAMTFFSAAGIFASGLYLPTYVQTALGASAFVSGLLVAPQAIGNLLSSIIGGQLVARTG